MTHCLRCHRPLKRATQTGMGPKCQKLSAPPPVVECDLFGYDIDKACDAARDRLALLIEAAAAVARIAIKREFRQAKVRLGVWS